MKLTAYAHRKGDRKVGSDLMIVFLVNRAADDDGIRRKDAGHVFARKLVGRTRATAPLRGRDKKVGAVRPSN